MIIITGAAGFIGSVLLGYFNQKGIDDILIVDDLGKTDKWKNLVGKQFSDYLHKDKFLEIIKKNNKAFIPKAVIHMGACSDTTEKNAEYLIQNNFKYSKELARWCLKNQIRFIYASSGATYGDGKLGFSDDLKLMPKLKPVNMYGYSKHLMDLWVIKNKLSDKLTGLKFFNVYGPNEYHKENMSSVVFKAFKKIKKTGRMGLFKSYLPEWEDGKQKRDFIYVKDVAEVVWWLYNNEAVNGIFNVGTGEARTWLDLVKAVFDAMDKENKIDFIEMPEEMRDRYQYFTEAKMTKLKKSGYNKKFASLENGIKDYVNNYLIKDNYF